MIRAKEILYHRRWYIIMQLAAVFFLQLQVIINTFRSSIGRKAFSRENNIPTDYITPMQD